MARHMRATDAEKRAYAAQPKTPVYPLYGWWVGVTERDGTEHCLAIEYPGEGDGGPNYEAMAPDGFHFEGDMTHTMLATDLKDLKDRLGGVYVVKCGADDPGCGCELDPGPVTKF